MYLYEYMVFVSVYVCLWCEYMHVFVECLFGCLYDSGGLSMG